MESTYEEKLLSVFKNFCFSGYEPFVVPILPEQEDHDYFNSLFKSGCLYRQLCFMLGEDLTLEQYYELNLDIDERFEDGNVICSFEGTDLVRIEEYYDGERSGKYVYPLLGACIRHDMQLLADSKK